jgi:glycine/D-amino acid oxidase-like deaminating enzyme
MAGLNISIIGAGPLGLQSAIEASGRGHKVEVASAVVPDSYELTKLITGGNAAGYGGPFGGKDPLIRGFVEQSWSRWMELARDSSYGPVREIKARIMTTDPEFLSYISRFDGYKSSTELGIDGCIEIDAYAFNPRVLLVEWVNYLRENHITVRQHNLTGSEVQSLRNGESLFGSDVTIECAGLRARDIHPELQLQPIRGVLGHFSASFEPGVTPISIMDEEGADLLYLIPRPGNIPGTWELVLGGTFDVGVGICGKEESEAIIRRKFDLTRERLAAIAPETFKSLILPNLKEVSEDCRPSNINGSPIFEHIKSSEHRHVLVVNGARGQGFVPVFALVQHALNMVEGFGRKA